MTERAFTAEVRGGELHGYRYGPDDDTAPAVLAIHGVTASSRAWLAVAAQLAGVRILAPDLRGRGHSRELPPPYGIRQHAEDLASLLETYDLEKPVVIGHSMGGFCAVALADRVEVAGLVLVDGGFPLAMPPGVTLDALIPQVLGPAAERLTMEFASTEAYRDYWRAHPAFARDWSPEVERYLDYDLYGEAPHLRPSTSIDAMTVDSGDQFGPGWYVDAIRGLRMPVTAMRAPRGLLDGDPLYASGVIEAFAADIPQLRVVEVADVNHYTIVMAERGASRVAAEVRSLL
jgi:lipase